MEFTNAFAAAEYAAMTSDCSGDWLQHYRGADAMGHERNRNTEWEDAMIMVEEVEKRVID